MPASDDVRAGSTYTNADDAMTRQRADRRDAVMRAALRAHDEAGCRCDRKYVMSCPQLVRHILEQGDTVIR